MVSDDPTFTVRGARAEDTSDVADIWHLGWQDGHLGSVPKELIEVRTEDSFQARASERIGDTTVATVDGAVAGFVMNDEGPFDYAAAGPTGPITVPAHRYTKLV